MEQNDRLIAVSIVSHTYNDINNIHDLNKNVREEIEHFFVSYNQQEGKTFKPEGWATSSEAMQMIEEAS
jgi:inorganic pyrophosphatase